MPATEEFDKWWKRQAGRRGWRDQHRVGFMAGFRVARRLAVEQLAEADRPSIAKQMLEHVIDEGYIDDMPGEW